MSTPLPTGYKRILTFYDIEILEFWNAVMSFLWGLWVLSPFWDTFATSSTFRVLGEIAPEWAWGLLVLTLGYFKASNLLHGRSAKRRILSLVSALLWLSISAGFFLSNIHSAAIVVYPLFAVADAVVFFRISTLKRL